MKEYRRIASLVTPAVLMAGYLMVPAVIKADEAQDSEQITKLLADVKTEAVELKRDAADMDSFARSKGSWESFASKIEMFKEHVNKAGKVLANLKDAEAGGSPWQQTAIGRIEPLLKELAANTEATIKHLNENQTKVHFTEFKDYVKANYEMATDLEEMIRDFVNYGETKRKFERLGEKLEVGG